MNLCNFAGNSVLEANLRQFLGLFGEVKVICSLRHQVPFLESWYRFRVWWSRSGETRDFPAYLVSKQGEAYLDYQNIERFFRSIWPDIDFEFVSFAEACKTGLLVKHFYEKAGILDCYAGEVKTNESLSRAGTLACLIWNRGLLPGTLSRQMFLKWLSQTFPDRRESLYDTALLEEVAAKFACRNSELALHTGFDLNDELAEFENKQTLAGSILSTEFQQLVNAFHPRKKISIFKSMMDLLPFRS